MREITDWWAPWVIVLVLACSGHAQPNADEQAEKAVRALAVQNVTVDGDLSDPAWQAGRWYSGFTVPGSTDLAVPQTRFAVCFDDTHLYVGVAAPEPNAEAILHAATERDGGIFRDDCIEIMIDPTGDRVRYYHFGVSASGAFYDAERRQGGHVVSKEWNSSAIVASKINTDSLFWIVSPSLIVVDGSVKDGVKDKIRKLAGDRMVSYHDTSEKGALVVSR